MASKSDRNSLIKCRHLLYTNRTAERAFRQTRMSSRAGAGGFGSTRQGIRCWKGWRMTRARGGKACGPIHSRCRRGSGGSGAGEKPHQSPSLLQVLNTFCGKSC